MKFKGAIAIFVALTCTPLLVFAQTATSTTAQPAALGGSQQETPQGLTSCFDYYTFGSTPVSITGELSKVEAGSPIGFEGTITNKNSYPIPDAYVYVKIFRVSSTSKNPSGPDVVDSFQAVGPIDLQAGQTQNISFTWTVPRDAQAGSYEAATYVTANDRFNLYGLSFSDDVVGSLASFSVVGGQSGSVAFDNSSMMVGTQPYYAAAFPPVVSGQQPVTVTATIDNTTKASANATVTWQLYYWDSLLPNGALGQSTQSVTVPANSKANVSYTVNDTTHSVYYLVGTVTSGRSKSIVEIRFTRPEINTPRISDVGVTGYPLSSNSTLFMCAHNTNDGIASSTEMDVSIEPTGIMGLLSWLIPPPHASYQGSIASNIIALAVPANGSYSSFTVDAKLYQNGTLVDQVQIPYDCSALSTGSCGSGDNTLLTIVGGIALVIVLLILLALAGKLRRGTTPPQL